ncbi:MAG: hypothetical protein WBA93_05530 [Microcoleaceae cyanobacterium]
MNLKRQKIAVLTEVKDCYQREIDRINRQIQELIRYFSSFWSSRKTSNLNFHILNMNKTIKKYANLEDEPDKSLVRLCGSHLIG